MNAETREDRVIFFVMELEENQTRLEFGEQSFKSFADMNVMIWGRVSSQGLAEDVLREWLVSNGHRPVGENDKYRTDELEAARDRAAFALKVQKDGAR